MFYTVIEVFQQDHTYYCWFKNEQVEYEIKRWSNNEVKTFKATG